MISMTALRRSRNAQPLSGNFLSMKVFRVVGLVLLIIALKILMSAVFAGFEDTLLQFFQFLQAALVTSQTALNGTY